MNCFCTVSRKPHIQKLNCVASTYGGFYPSISPSTFDTFRDTISKDFFVEHTKVDIDKVSELSDRFRNLEIDSRLEIVFKGKTKGFEVPSHSVFTHQSEYGLVIFELETRVTSRYIPPGADCLELEIERTDDLNYIINNSEICSQLGSRRVSYTPSSNNVEVGKLT
jgi:hypothetical protein